MPFTIRPAAVRGLVCLFGALALLSGGCSPEAREPATPASLVLGAPIVAVPRPLSADAVKRLREGLGDATRALQGDRADTFYLALRKSELGQRWFMSVFLKQNYPEDLAGTGGSSMGVRVVSFQEQNGKLYAFDVDDTKVRSTLFEPEEIVEAWPIITDHRDFNRLPGSDAHVLIDPAAGLDRVSGVDELRGIMYGPAFEVELAFAQRFRELEDGVAFEKVLTGHGQLLDYDTFAWLQDNFRVTATVGIALRRYQEGAGYTPTPLPAKEHYFRSPARRVPDSGGLTTQVAAKWNIHPGMQPIPWVLSDTLLKLQQDPRYKDYDFIGAMRRGVENWNAAFGFPVFTTRMATPGESIADDDKNFLLVDPDSTYNFAYASSRLNPNTGEVLGASVYMSRSMLNGALRIASAPPAVSSDEEARPAPGGFRPRWNGMEDSRLCELDLSELEAAMAGAPGLDAAHAPGQPALTPKERAERYVTYIVMHEVGHTLGLRHNFKGSLVVPSSSVMEYSLPEAMVLRGGEVGPYDVSAVRYLYGLSSTLPQEPFCPDEQVRRDPDCNRHDASPVPLEQFYGAAYRTALTASLDAGGAPPLDTQLNGVLQYVRGGRSSAERMLAWNLAVEGIQAPIPPEVLAANPSYGPAADEALRRVLQRLYLDGFELRGSSFFNDPRPDPVLTPALLTQLRATLLDVDGVRSYPSRRVVVQVLKKLQTFEAYAILREARLAVEARLPGLSGQELLAAEDLLARLQQATAPYFP